MKTYRTALLLEDLHQQVEKHIREAIGDWQNRSPLVMNASPAPGSWSATECIEHLNIYGRYYLPAIAKAIEKAIQQKKQTAPVFKSGWLGNYFTNLMKTDLSGQAKKKMKTPPGARPANNLDATTVIAAFIDQQEQLQKLIREAAHVNISKTRVPISIAPFIKLKLGDVFMFIVAHNERHIRQAERAMSTQPQTLLSNQLLP